MRDFRDARAMVHTPREVLNTKPVLITHKESLELVAKILGFHGWTSWPREFDSTYRRVNLLVDSSSRTEQLPSNGGCA